MTISRRSAMIGAATLLAAPLLARAQQGRARLVILGGGFGGAAAARFARDTFPELDVTLIERSRRFVTCPYGNLVLAGLRRMEDITFGYEGLTRLGVRVVHAEVAGIDPAQRSVRIAGADAIPYDRLIVSPGIDIRWGALEGYDQAAAERLPHGWIPHLQPITGLRRQLEAMPDGGVFLMAIPDNPFRCPPGPYERISMVAHYLKQAKPRSKVLALDAKGGFSKQPLFVDAWAELYGPMVEWVGGSTDGKVMRADAAAMELESEFGQRHKGAVINVIPPQAAASVAREAGLANASGWCPVRPRTMESTLVPGIHVIGDAAIMAPMPKSGFAAASQAKQAVAAAAAALAGREVPEAIFFNTCYSHVGTEYGISVVGVYRSTDAGLAEVAGSGGISSRGRLPEQRRLEARYADGWYASITQEIFAIA